MKFTENPNIDSEMLNNVEDDNWFIDQKISTNTTTENLLNTPKYGFGNKLSNALAAFEVSFIKFFFYKK